MVSLDAASVRQPVVGAGSPSDSGIQRVGMVASAATVASNTAVVGTNSGRRSVEHGAHPRLLDNCVYKYFAFSTVLSVLSLLMQMGLCL